MPLKYLKHGDSDIAAQCQIYKHKVYSQNTYSELIEFLLKTLEGYDEVAVM